MNKYLIKGTLYILIFLGISVMAYYVAIKMSLLPNPFEEKKAYILETPAIVKEIKSIAELYSVCYYDQLIIDSVYKSKTILGKVASFTDKNNLSWMTGPTAVLSLTNNDKDKRLMYIVKSRIYAGFDLGGITDSSIVVNGDTLLIKLNQPKIMDILVNPSDFTTFIEEGKWSFEEVKFVKNKAVAKFKERALQRGIIADAEKKGKESIELFFKSLGFKQVMIENK